MTSQVLKIFLFLIIGFCMVFFSHCTSTTNPIDKLHKEVMKIHDEVMPKQSALSAAQLSAKKWLARQERNFTPGLDMMDNLKALAVAEESMWEWMNQYSKPKGSLEEDLDYLQNQKIEIQKISDQMNSALKVFEEIKSKYDL